MSTNLNASKTAKPIETDLQLLAMLTGMRRTIDINIAEAKKVGREDIAESEATQGRILDEYIHGSGLEVLTEEKLRPMVLDAIEAAVQKGKKGKAIVGEVIKQVKAAAEGKVVDAGTLGVLANELVERHTKQS